MSERDYVRTNLNIALFGAPGSGKGTQAGLLLERFNLLHLSTGDLLRAERKADSPLGRRVSEIMSRGELVSDEIVSEVVQNQVQKAHREGRGVLFDGYPRNLAQLETLEAILNNLKTELHLSISLEIEEQKLIERLTGRRVCEDCQRVYNVVTRPPKQADICDSCGAGLIHRSDDRLEAISIRLKEYHRQTEPMLNELKRQGNLQTVSGDGAIDVVAGTIGRIVESLLPAVAGGPSSGD